MAFGCYCPWEKFLNASWRTISGFTIVLVCNPIVYTTVCRLIAYYLTCVYSTFKAYYSTSYYTTIPYCALYYYYYAIIDIRPTVGPINLDVCLAVTPIRYFFHHTVHQ